MHFEDVPEATNEFYSCAIFCKAEADLFVINNLIKNNFEIFHWEFAYLNHVRMILTYNGLHFEVLNDKK